MRILQDSDISLSSQLRVCDRLAAQPSPPALCLDCSWGYANQMLLKLLLAAHLHTEFYLTLDADVLLRQSLRCTSSGAGAVCLSNLSPPFTLHVAVQSSFMPLRAGNARVHYIRLFTYNAHRMFSPGYD